MATFNLLEYSKKTPQERIADQFGVKPEQINPAVNNGQGTSPQPIVRNGQGTSPQPIVRCSGGGGSGGSGGGGSGGSGGGTTTSTVTIGTPIYENVLDTEKYQAYLDAKKTEFEKEKAEKVKQKEIEVKAKQETERKRSLVKEKVMSAVSTAKDVIGGINASLAKRRSESYKARQEKIVEVANTELSKEFEEMKTKYESEAESAKKDYMVRKQTGTKYTTYTTTTVTPAPECSVSQVSKDDNIPKVYTPQVQAGLRSGELKIVDGRVVQSKPVSFISSNMSVKEYEKYLQDFTLTQEKQPSYIDYLAGATPSIKKAYPVDTKTLLVREYVAPTPSGYVAPTLGVISATSKKTGSSNLDDLKFKQAVESFSVAQTTMMKPLTESTISQKVSAVNTFVADTTNLFAPYKNLSEGNFLSAVVKTPSYIVGTGATAVGSVVGLSAGIGEFASSQIIDYYGLQGSADERFIKLLSPESARKTLYLPIEATKASSLVAGAGLNLLAWEVSTGFSKTQEVAGGVVKGTVESAFTDPIKFGVETLVFDKAFKGLKLATGFSKTSVAVESGKSLAKTSFLTKPVTSAYVQGEKIFATTTYKVKVGGLLGSRYEVVSKAIISKDDVAKAMFNKNLLKIGGVKNASSLVDDVSKNIVNVSDDVSVAVKKSLGKSVTDLVKIDGGDLTKFVSKTGKSKAGRINLNDLVGDFVFTKAEGVTYVRPIGLLETAKVSLLGVEKSVGLKKNVIEAEKRVLGSKSTVSSVLSVESIAQVSPREIVSKSIKDKVYSTTASGKKLYNVGLNQGVSDSTSLVLQQTKNNLSSFRRVVVEPIVGKVKGFKTSLTGTKGKIVSAESFVDESKLISPLQKFKTTDISFTTDAGEVVLSKVKVGKFPIQTVLLEPAKKSVLEGTGAGFQKPLTYRIKERVMNLLQEPQKRLVDSQKLLTGETFTDIIPKDIDIEKMLARFSTSAMSGLGEASLKSAQKGIGKITPSTNVGSVATGSGLRLLVNQKIDSKTDSGLKVETKTDVASKTDTGRIRIGDEKIKDSFKTKSSTFTDVRTEFAKLRDSTSTKSMFESASKQDSLSLFKVDYSSQTINRVKTETRTRQDTRLRQDNALRFDLGRKQDYGLKVSQKVDVRLRQDLQPKTRTLELEAQKLKTPFPKIVVSPPKTPVILKSVKTPSFRAPLDNIRKIRERITIRKTKPIFQLKADLFRKFVSAEGDIPVNPETIKLRGKLWGRFGSARAFIPTKQLLEKNYIKRIGFNSGKEWISV
jgi:hypothetical protein